MTINVPSGRLAKLSDYESASVTPNSTVPASRTFTIEAGKGFSAGDAFTALAVGTKLPTRMRFASSTYNPVTGVLAGTMSGLGFEPDNFFFTPLTIGTGLKTFVIESGKNLVAGDLVVIANATSFARFMRASVTAYDNLTGDITVNVTAIGLTGTYSDWTITTDATVSNWVITPVENESISVLGNAQFTVDKSPKTPFGSIAADTLGKINVVNSSTTTPSVLTVSTLGYSQSALRAKQNGIINIQGDWINIGTGTGAPGQAFQSPTSIDAPTKVDVLLSNGTRQRWSVVPSSGSTLVGKFPVNLVPADFKLGDDLMGSVFFFNYDTKTLTSRNAVPVGAAVQIPNIHITKALFATTLAVAATATDATLSVVNYWGLGTSGVLLIDGEYFNYGTRTNNVLTVTRASYGSTAATHAKGSKVVFFPTTGTGGQNGMPVIDTNPSGSLYIDKASLGICLINAINHNDMRLTNLGIAGSPNVITSPAGVYGRNITLVPRADLPYSHSSRLNLQSLFGRIDVSELTALAFNGQSGQSFNGGSVLVNNFGAAQAGLQISSAVDVADSRDVVSILPKKQIGNIDSTASAISGLSTSGWLKLDGWSAVGGKFQLDRVSNTNIVNLRFEDCADGAQQTVQASNVVNLYTCQNINFVSPRTLYSAPRNVFVLIDANSANINVYGASCPINDQANQIASHLGAGLGIYNTTFGRFRAGTPFGNSAGFGAKFSNVRFPVLPYAYPNLNVSYGLAYSHKTDYQGVSSKNLYFTQASANFMPYKDCAAISILFDDETATTGKLAVGSFSVEQDSDYVDYIGDAYFDQGGRAYFINAGDGFIFKSVVPARSITQFVNTELLIEQFGLYGYSIGNAGAGLATYNTYNLVGGSGTGGKIRQFNSTTVVQAPTTPTRICAGEGYQIGDILTVQGGTTNPVITITNVPVIEFRLALPGEDITAKPWKSCTKANRASAIAALGAGYSPSAGFQIHIKVTSTIADTGAGIWLDSLYLPTANDPTYVAPDSQVNFLNCGNADTVILRRSNGSSTTFTGGGLHDATLGTQIGTSVYAERYIGATLVKTTAPVMVTSLDAPIEFDLRERLSVTIKGLQSSDVWKLINTATSTEIAQGSGNGTFTLNPSNIGVNVYATRLRSSVVLASTYLSSVQLVEGAINEFSLFAGDEVQIAQAEQLTRIDALPTLDEIEASAKLAKKSDVNNAIALIASI